MARIDKFMITLGFVITFFYLSGITSKLNKLDFLDKKISSFIEDKKKEGK